MMSLLKNLVPGGDAAPAGATRGRLELRCVARHYPGSDRPAMTGIDLVIEPGEFVVVVGPSGCGKSTLLSLVAGLATPSEGQVLLDGKPVTKPGPDRPVVFQEHGLFPWLTVAQNVEFGLKMEGVPKDERRAAAVKALKMVHLEDSAGKFIHQLSGGMRQRVAIARCLVLDPAVMLMDEPFSALDAQTRTLLHEQVQELYVETRKTVLFVTHSVGEAVRLADRIVVMRANPGRIRRDIHVNLPHPRNFDTAEVAQVMAQVRREIDEEVNSHRGVAAKEGASYEI